QARQQSRDPKQFRARHSLSHFGGRQRQSPFQQLRHRKKSRSGDSSRRSRQNSKRQERKRGCATAVSFGVRPAWGGLQTTDDHPELRGKPAPLFPQEFRFSRFIAQIFLRL